MRGYGGMRIFCLPLYLRNYMRMASEPAGFLRHKMYFLRVSNCYINISENLPLFASFIL